MRSSHLRVPGRAGWARLAAGLLLAAGAFAPVASRAETAEPAHSAELDAAIIRAAKLHGVPERLVRRVVMRESRYNPRARNHSFWGLMQISYPTARSMGFKGTPQELLNPVTNLTYAVPYLANAFVAAGKREDAAIRLYASGYYDTARHRGLLGAMRTAESAPAPGFHEDQVATAEQPNDSFFGWFGTSQASPDAQPAPPPTLVEAQVTPAAEPVAPAPARVVARRGRAEAEAADRSGIPAKWRRDGGTTILARGEQSPDRVAALTGVARAGSRHVERSRKSTESAALDTPPTAQAYSTVGNDAATAPPQVAISQAIAPEDQALAQVETQPADADGATAKSRRKPAAAKHRVATKPAKGKTLGTVAELKP